MRESNHAILDRFETESFVPALPGGEDGEQPPRRRFGRLAVAAALAALLAAGVYAAHSFWGGSAPALAFSEVDRGDVVKTVTATGRLEAVQTVEVGSQISGTVAALYADFNDRVRKGQVIARLDSSQLEALLAQARANLSAAQAGAQAAESAVTSAEANVAAAEANRERMRAAAEDARRTAERNLALFKAAVLAREASDASQATADQAAAQLQQTAAQLNQARAQLVTARSQLAQARAQQEQARAAVEIASVNLSRAVITAPVDGVVIARNVDVGQTVAASLQAPTLFVIAKDLGQMQVLADIDEADVGQLTPASRVTFTVDAFPRDTFRGRIRQIRLNPQTVQNVVTYTAVIDVANPELKLKPGMTANVTAVVAEGRNVLRVPNAALRFRPDGGGADQPAAAAPGGRSAARDARQPVVWKLEPDGQLQPVKVTLGVTDGVYSELVAGSLREGDRVATGQKTDGVPPASPARSPLMPFGRRGRR